MLENFLAEELIGMVGDADEAAELEIMQPCLFLDLAEGTGFDGFAGFLLAFGQVPEIVSVNEQVFSFPVPDQAAAGGHFLEVGAEFLEISIIHGDAFVLEIDVLHFLLTLYVEATAKLVFPAEFINDLRESLGPERAERVLTALSSEPEVSVRVNPFKLSVEDLRAHFVAWADDAVSWAPDEGLYLAGRPSFTLDPLFHAGAYYVQEASSMYVGGLFDRAKASLGKNGLRVLDLCAAPGGKTTQLLSHLDAASLLVANEIVPARATVLAENVARWGCPNVAVTSSDPSAFTPLRDFFDVAVVDAPCSGEGMFRKDGRAVAEWSPDHVRLCAARQRRILGDVWPAIAPGGFLIYSTCTFNRFEDEENADWICAELGAECLDLRHFYPGEDRGEGFFAALLRKKGSFLPGNPAADAGLAMLERGSLVKIFPAAFVRDLARLEKSLKVIASGVAVATRKGRDLVPEADFALAMSDIHAAASGLMPDLSYEKVEVLRNDALKFLSKDVLVLPDAPRGYLLLTYEGQGLGFVKNLGNRTNSLLPPARRIRQRI